MTLQCCNIVMEDREWLKKQIEQLQNLINNHKSIHGDAPSSSAQWASRRPAHTRGRGGSTRFSPIFPNPSKTYSTSNAGQWRRKYSLSNRHTSAPSKPNREVTTQPIPVAAGEQDDYRTKDCVTELDPSTTVRTHPGVSGAIPVQHSKPIQPQKSPHRITKSHPKPGPSQHSKSKYCWVKGSERLFEAPPNLSTQPISIKESSLLPPQPISSKAPHPKSPRPISSRVPLPLSPRPISSRVSPTLSPQPINSKASCFLSTTRYTWVSARPTKKPRSPKPTDTPQRKPKQGPSRPRKAPSGIAQSQSNRYRWKASQLPLPDMTRRASVYRWFSKKECGPNRPVKVSRVKSSNSSSSSPSSGLVSQRRRTQPPALVLIGRHKLCRLAPPTSPGHSRTGSSSPRTPVLQRVIKTRYKIVTRRGSAGSTYVPHFSPSHTWRVKRVQSARVLLQSRLHAGAGVAWRGRSMRWIGGLLYRVSANKLCRTAVTPTQRNKPGRSSTPVSPHSVIRGSSTRHLASRALQRSRSIMRHALQRRQPSRQFCMYYNRFGRCNRGNDCQYVHDPDKVAVCTRFLRGTCKQTDGSCPFSHKVAKEKMPVCSYFLKGICSSTSCPYSHVYVSRKAAVCQDFIRGYCPAGEKCKKKHTLVCPDFSKTGSCPRGSRCKQQHRLQKPPGNTRTRARHSPDRCKPDVTESCVTEALDPNKLPSFISLSSSPDKPSATETEVTEVAGRSCGSSAPEKKFQIKPRF